MLDRYRKLKQEIPVLELELLMMKNTEAGLGNDTIFDYQTGYPRPQSVVGFDQKKYDRREKILERKKEKVKAMDQWIDDMLCTLFSKCRKDEIKSLRIFRKV